MLRSCFTHHVNSCAESAPLPSSSSAGKAMRSSSLLRVPPSDATSSMNSGSSTAPPARSKAPAAGSLLASSAAEKTSDRSSVAPMTLSTMAVKASRTVAGGRERVSGRAVSATRERDHAHLTRI